MGKIRRKFDSEFKSKIAQRVLAGEQTRNSIAREFGICPNLIKKWTEQFSNQSLDKNRSTATERLLFEENRQLKEKLGELYMQVELLKKVPAFVQTKRSATSSIVTSSNLAQSLRGAK
jgi:transposase-like protein